MSDYKSFELLEKLYFVRTGGSQEELTAANILLNQATALGDEAHLEEFEVDGATIHEAKLTFNDPEMEVECAGVGYSGNAAASGLTGEFCYITCLADAEISDVKDKICLIDAKLVRVPMYRTLIKRGAKGLIFCTGSVYDDADKVDLDPYMYRPRLYDLGKIPAVLIRISDAEKVLRANPKTATMVLSQDEYKNKSHNVVATIEGTTKKDEIVAFSAHYDSVSYSKGAYDNATGSTGIMQLLAYYSKNRPARTLKFIWCGSEEMGLLGSKAYVQAHKEELENYKLNINIDMIGVTLGKDIACCTTDTDLVNFINYEGMINGFPIMAKQGVYSSDSTPFADNGVPAVSFARISPSGGAVIHSRKDVMDFLSEDNYYRTLDFMANCTSRLINSVAFPVTREIPEKMKEELDYYNGRKEKKN